MNLLFVEQNIKSGRSRQLLSGKGHRCKLVDTGTARPAILYSRGL